MPDTTTHTETTIETESTITTIISQIIETVTKTAEGFSVIFVLLGLPFIALRRRKEKK